MGGVGGSRGPPDPDFNYVNVKSRFFGEGGVKDHTTLRSRFYFVSINGQLGSLRVSQSEQGQLYRSSMV